MGADRIDRSTWPPLPAPHAAFLEPALLLLRSDVRIVGVAAAGSFARSAVDEHSDIDLVVAIEPPHFDDVVRDRSSIAQSLGPLLVAFSGEHVGAPQLLICLYGPPLLHVDLKFVALPDAAHRVDDCVVLWERDGRLRVTLATERAAYPAPDLQWIEDRIWAWVHYLAAKIARGELFETLDGLGYVRARVLGPHALQFEGGRRSRSIASCANAARARRSHGGARRRRSRGCFQTRSDARNAGRSR